MKFRTIMAPAMITLTLALTGHGTVGTASGSTGTAGFAREVARELSASASDGNTAGEKSPEGLPAVPATPRMPAKKTEARRAVNVDGASLYYTSNCASCHGTMTNMKGATAETIRFAIDNNVGGMGFHVNLSPEEIRAIADSLR